MDRRFLLLMFALFSCMISGAQTMEYEAVNFIAGLPAELQTLQERAVRMAINGDSSGLEEVRSARNFPSKLPDGVISTDINGIYRIYTPLKKAERPLPLLIYFHGGGWCFGSINSCSSFCASLAKEAQIAVLAVEYPLAPENPYPAALVSGVDALNYAAENAVMLGIDSGAISIGGDSAGGNLALATALRMVSMQETLKDSAAQDKLPKIRSLVLFYPVVKAWNDASESWQKYGYGYGLDGKIMETFNEAYIGGNDPGLPLISPYCASTEHLSQLPPTLIVNADHDILRDQGREMFERMKMANVDVIRKVLPGTTHLFITVAGQPTAFRKSVSLTKEFLCDKYFPQI